MRQKLFSCLTCKPPPEKLTDSYEPAAVCYSCSIQCHGEHILVELFNKRDFACDCGTTRLPITAPCTLRLNPQTNSKGGVYSEAPELTNQYNQNFRNRFCGCECDYEADKQKGTMFQCLGLGTAESGGCGEDWWHPGCVVGLTADWNETQDQATKPTENKSDGLLSTITEVAEASVEERETNDQASDNQPGPDAATTVAEDVDDDDPPLPPGFPHEDDFDGFICYKCVEAYPWIKRYANAPGFLPAVFKRSPAPSPEKDLLEKAVDAVTLPFLDSKKRKANDDEEINVANSSVKRQKEDTTNTAPAVLSPPPTKPKTEESACKLTPLPQQPSGRFSLFFKPDFRDHLCRCKDCFPLLKPHPQLLEEEDTYEPPLSEGSQDDGGSTVGSGSIYDRGESALKNVDRVRAIEGVMAYNHLKDKLTPFFKQFAESGKAISAEDIKAHFAKMRGDEQAIKDAAEGAKEDSRKEQSGY